MSAIGPALPPHLLAKRKRQQDEETKNASSAASGAKRALSPDDSDKRRRVMGPAMPPAPLDERPSAPARSDDGESDDSDDDFGPALPSAAEATKSAEGRTGDSDASDFLSTARPQPPEKLQRDDWMMIPPKQDDLAARLDPSKPRPKGFNTGKGARGGMADGDNSTWHETPEQKRRRLENEMMGIAQAPSASSSGGRKPLKDTATPSRKEVKETQARGPSLLEQHQKHKGSEVEDDPSKRAFDREKDMGGGMRISSSQRKSLLDRASNFESRFSKGSSR